MEQEVFWTVIHTPEKDYPYSLGIYCTEDEAVDAAIAEESHWLFRDRNGIIFYDKYDPISLEALRDVVKDNWIFDPRYPYDVEDNDGRRCYLISKVELKQPSIKVTKTKPNVITTCVECDIELDDLTGHVYNDMYGELSCELCYEEYEKLVEQDKNKK